MRTAEDLRNKKQVYYDDLEVGQELPSYAIADGPLTATHMFRWSAAMENFHRIHYDQDFAIYHDGLPNVLGQGSWKQSVLPGYLKDQCLPDGWMWKVSLQNRAMIVPGTSLTCWSKVTNKYEKDGLGFVELECGIKNEDDIETAPATATIVLPIRGGRPIPYPFVPPKEE
ncbi:MaoC family dehydratase [Chloroflexota bacterium]